MKRLLILLLATAFAGAAEVTSYELRLDASKDGAGKVIATVKASDCAAGTLNLPLGFKAIENLRLEKAPKDVQIEPGPSNGQSLIRIHLPEGAPATTEIQFSFSLAKAFVKVELGPGEKSSLPAGSLLFRHVFVNTQEGTIGRYRFELLFPEDTRAQAIREQLPKLAKSEAGPRVRLSRIDGRQAAVLQLADLKQGDDTSMALELVPERKSWGWLIAGLALALIYLVRFRDLVSPAKN